jgi:alkylated DNA repair dioxygenase AlkB
MNANTISGLSYLPNFLTPEATGLLTNAIDTQPWETTLSRRTQQYGYSYVHKSAVLNRAFLGELPGFLSVLAERLVAEGHFATLPDQVIINEYEPGQGIGLHVDATVYFGPVVASLSLLAPVIMQFAREDAKAELWLEPGSLLVLRGAARTDWKHGIAARQTDRWEDIAIPRQRRISVTFRTLLR